jgi:hypothetical protein
MTAHKKPEVLWHQKNFEFIKSKWSPERSETDEKRLKDIFRQAAQVPVLKEALEWAEMHGVRYFIDRSCVGIGGYYTPGTGVVAIAEVHTRSELDFIRTIVHETRHAWQDYHGLLQARTLNFSEYFIKISLAEADAYAFERRAVDEFKMAELKGLYHPRDVRYALSVHEGWPCSEEYYLRAMFLEWFSSPRPKSYGDTASKNYGQIFGVYSGVMPERNSEHKSTLCVEAIGPGLDITDSQDILKLGKTFSGKNYLAKLPRDILLKKILRPGLAMSFYEAANDDQKRLVAELRKYYLRGRRNYNFLNPSKLPPFKK